MTQRLQPPRPHGIEICHPILEFLYNLDIRPMNVNWHGVYPAAITHFHDDDSLDIPSTLKHVDVMIEAGIHGLIMLGATDGIMEVLNSPDFAPREF